MIGAIFLAIFAAPVAAFAIGCFLEPPRSRYALALAFLSPLIVYTIGFAAAEPAEPGFWGWWAVGLMMLAMPMGASIVIAVPAYLLGRSMMGPEEPMRARLDDQG